MIELIDGPLSRQQLAEFNDLLRDAVRQCGFSETAINAVHFIERNGEYEVALIGVPESEMPTLICLMQHYGLMTERVTTQVHTDHCA